MKNVDGKEDENFYEILLNKKTEIIIGTSFDVMNELGSGFLESVYHHSL